MKSENQKITIETYEKEFSKYLEKTPSEISGDSKEYLDQVLSKLDKNMIILEIGTATGRDADYIESKGFNILRSDVVDSFIALNNQKNKEVIKFNIITDNLDKKFDAILARAVFLHFNDKEFVKAINNVQHHLHEKGIFAFTLKIALGEEVSSHKMDSPRYFKYWQKNDVEFVIKDSFEILFSTIDSSAKWLQLILRKK